MVALLLRLRFRILGNTLRRSPLQLLAVVVGGMLGAGLVFVALGGMLIASTMPPAVIQAVVVIGGAALVCGWLVVPLLFDGVDRTLDPVRLARYPLRTGTLMAATFVVGITWLPGIATIVVSVGTAIAWRTYPAAAVAAVLGGLIGAATCIGASRLMTSVAGSLLRGRGAARIGMAALGVLVLAVPFAIATTGGVDADGRFPGFTAALDVLSWSPLGAAWSIAGRLATGDLAGAATATAIALTTLVVTLLLWRLALGASLRVRGERPPRAIGAGRLGPLGWVPTSPTGAVFARSLMYWFRDGRQARQLILLPVLPVLMLLWWTLFDVAAIAWLIGPIVASLLPLSAFAGLSYDGTAFAAELAAGVRGVHDRVGRALALLTIAAPTVVVVQLAVAIVIDGVGDLPALLGVSLGILLISVGVVSVSSAQLVVPVTRAGRNPFSAQAGAATTSIFASYAVAVVTIVLTLPVIAPAVGSLVTGIAWLGWVALVSGLGLGAAVALGGMVLGGRVLDASGPAVLARLRLIRS